LRNIYIISTCLATAGLLLSAYLTLLPPPTFCDINNFFSCDTVLSSPYAKIGGIPTAFLGVVWFAAATILSPLAVRSPKASKALFITSIVAVAGVLVLIYIELVAIGAICLLCTTAHLLGIGVLTSSIIGLRASHV
jgi:uncharacterized membrane protein